MSVNTRRGPVDRRLPPGVHLLAFSLFAMGSAEFLVAGDQGVPLSPAGALIPAFAIGVVVGGLLTDGSGLLPATRFVAGLACAGFWAVAAATAISLVPPDRAARASGVVVGGLSLAMIAGGPASALLGHFTGWRGGTGPARPPSRGGRVMSRPRNTARWCCYPSTPREVPDRA